MRVLATGMEWFDENPGGLPRYFADYTAAWARKGDDIRALVRTGSPQPSDRPGYVKSIFSSSQNPMRVRSLWKESLRHELSLNPYDVFNPHFAYYAWAWDGLNIDMPVVTHFHGPWAYEGRAEAGEQTRWTAELSFRFQRAIEQRVYRSSDRFIVLSQSFLVQLRDYYGVPEDRIHVVPGAVNTRRFHDTSARDRVRATLGLPENALILLSVRRLARRMGLDRLIRAAALLRNDFPNVHLVIVGGGERYEELKELIRDLGVEAMVHLTNRVSDDVLPLYYQAADLTVVPSVSLEGFGLSTVESMACGTPVAGTPVGGTREILEPFAPDLLFTGTSTEQIADGLRSLLSGSKRIPSRSETRKHVCTHYTWEAVLPQIESVFQQACTCTR